MIFAAGLGTRLRPITNTIPKALVPVGGRPLIAHVLERLRAAGFTRVVVNVHHFAQQIVDYLDANYKGVIDIAISDESDRLLDTGGGIKKARSLFDTSRPVLIHNVDIMSNADLAALYDTVDCRASRPDAALLVSWRQTKRYLLFDDKQCLRAWMNIQTGEVKCPREFTPDVARLTQLAFSGIHVMAPQALEGLDDMPERFNIIDFYLKHCRDMAFMACRQEGLKLLDVGKIETLDMAELFCPDSQNTSS